MPYAMNAHTKRTNSVLTTINNTVPAMTFMVAISKRKPTLALASVGCSHSGNRLCLCGPEAIDVIKYVSIE
jgi:hypothetical protein